MRDALGQVLPHLELPILVARLLFAIIWTPLI